LISESREIPDASIVRRGRLNHGEDMQKRCRKAPADLQPVSMVRKAVPADCPVVQRRPAATGQDNHKTGESLEEACIFILLFNSWFAAGFRRGDGRQRVRL
jgi:hypothetical protein